MMTQYPRAGATMTHQNVRSVLQHHGGVARWADLNAAGVSRADLDAALTSGELSKVAYGVYALPAADSWAVAAVAANGFVSHASAAIAWNLDVLKPPQKLHITLAPQLPAPPDCHVHRVRHRDLAAITTREPFAMTTLRRTLIDCARTMPFREALVVVDSALRRPDLSQQDLQEVAVTLRGPGAAAARRALLAGDGRSDSVGETLLRAAALEAGAPPPELQHPIILGSRHSSGFARIDLAWPDYKGRPTKVAVEHDEHDQFDADGARTDTFDRDRERWLAMQDEGWTLRIFTYAHATDRYEQTGARILQALDRRYREVSSTVHRRG